MMRNPKIALEQKAYMSNQFEFYGLKATERKKERIFRNHFIKLSNQFIIRFKRIFYHR